MLCNFLTSDFSTLCKHLSCHLFGPKGASGPPFQELVGTILKTSWRKDEKVKTVFPCGREHQNQAFEGMCVHVFRDLYACASWSSICHVFFRDFATLETILSPFQLNFGRHFDMISTIIFRASKTQNYRIQPGISLSLLLGLGR